MKKFLIYFISTILVIILAASAYFSKQVTPTTNPGWGVSFSRTYAEYLGYDWKTMYLDILNDLQPKKLRLMAYWEILEREPDLWYFQDIDEMLVEADKRGIEVILAVGHKLPRWPECHHPAWYNDLSEDEKRTKQLEMVEMTVNHFKAHDSIKIWQVEHEPLTGFGSDCPKMDKKLLEEEVALVRALDPRPILVSDSGALGSWIPKASVKPDIIGSSMYRVVHKPRLGYFEYPWPAVFFRVKTGMTESFTDVARFKGMELQAEPWFAEDLFKTDLPTQFALMNPTILENNITYARKTGFEGHYLWGVEWWYWLAHKHNDWGMWNAGKNILNPAVDNS